MTSTYKQPCHKCSGSGQVKWGMCYDCNGKEFSLISKEDHEKQNPTYIVFDFSSRKFSATRSFRNVVGKYNQGDIIKIGGLDVELHTKRNGYSLPITVAWISFEHDIPLMRCILSKTIKEKLKMFSEMVGDNEKEKDEIKQVANKYGLELESVDSIVNEAYIILK